MCFLGHILLLSVCVIFHHTAVDSLKCVSCIVHEASTPNQLCPPDTQDQCTVYSWPLAETCATINIYKDNVLDSVARVCSPEKDLGCDGIPVRKSSRITYVAKCCPDTLCNRNL